MAKQPQPNAEKSADAKASDAPAATAAAQVAKKLVVAKGCSLTGLRGIVADGADFSINDVPGKNDEERGNVIAGLLLSGHLVEVDA